MKMIDPDELQNRFTYHPPTSDQVITYQMIRNEALQFAFKINVSCPDSRERSLALTHLEEVVMWANASIARNT